MNTTGIIVSVACLAIGAGIFGLLGYFAGYCAGERRGQEDVLKCCHYRRRLMRDLLRSSGTKFYED